MSNDEEKGKKDELDLSSPEVVNKYKTAAEVVNKALQRVIAECKPKAKIVDVCELGDSFIREQTQNMYKHVGKKVERGVACPTSISVNTILCHFSPFASDESVLEEGDIVKIDMGCHIDGFIALVAHTHAIQAGPITGRAADVIAAANTAAEVALRLLKPGKMNKDVTEAIQKVAAAYDCKLLPNVSHQMKQNVIYADKLIASTVNNVEAEFEENEVYSIDILARTGEGKLLPLDTKQSTIYQKNALNRPLSSSSARSIYSEICHKFPHMLFTARGFKESTFRRGISECLEHDLLEPYHVLLEKPGHFAAHIKFTVLLMPNRSDRITSHPLQELQPTKQVDDPEIKAWLALGTKTKKKGGRKKSKKGDKVEGSTEAAEPTDATNGAETQKQ